MISIIIPTYFAEAYLTQLLPQIQKQVFQEFELIIIDSSSKDDTIKIAEQYTDNLIIIPQEEFDHGGTRAKAARMAKGEIIIFLTQDILPYDEHMIDKIIDPFTDPSIGAAYGRQLSYEDTNLFGKHLRSFNYPEHSSVKSKKEIPQYGIKTAQLSNSFAAYRKSTLEQVGYFKDDLILGEDVYTGAKMILSGYKLAYSAEAKVYHSHSYTVFQEFKRYFDIGVFHKNENWILKEFGKAEGEGMRYIKSELDYLFTHGAWYLLPEFFFRNAMKYLGYKLGMHHERLPKSLILKVSMHHRWWSNRNTKSD